MGTTSLRDARSRVYEIRVCSVCRAGLDWCAEDGEGMFPRAWCQGSDRHLVIDGDTHRDPYPLRIVVQEVVDKPRSREMPCFCGTQDAHRCPAHINPVQVTSGGR